MKEPERTFARVERERLCIGQHKAISPKKPWRIRIPNAVHDFRLPDDPATVQHLERRYFRAVGFRAICSILILSASHPFSGVDQESPTNLCRPFAVFDVFASVAYQPCPWLADRQHRRTSRRSQPANSLLFQWLFHGLFFTRGAAGLCVLCKTSDHLRAAREG